MSDEENVGEMHGATAWGAPLDAYALLGVPRGASAEAVKQRYREKVKDCHPDLGNEPDRVETFLRLTQAYHTLLAAATLSPVAPTGGTSASPVGSEAGRRAAESRPAASYPSESPDFLWPDPAMVGGRRAAAAGRGGGASAGHGDAARRARELAIQAQRRLGEAGPAAQGEAEEIARQALRVDRDCAEAYVVLAELLNARGACAEAVGCASLAVQLRPASLAARALLQRLRSRGGSGSAGFVVGDGDRGSEDIPAGSARHAG